jgi:hypothetical protein
MNVGKKKEALDKISEYLEKQPENLDLLNKQVSSVPSSF